MSLNPIYLYVGADYVSAFAMSAFVALKEKGLRKPSPEQLSLSAGLSSVLSADDFRAADGTDCRNYGVLQGLPEARALGADLLDLATSQVLACGNSSLELMYDFLAAGMLFGMPGFRPWKEAPSVSVVCPVPGYDRHFAICEALGIRMINVPLKADGPDMDRVEAIVERDASVKGIWCVPLFGGAGVAFLASSNRNLHWWCERAKVRSIGPDKMNQLRHVRFLRDRHGVEQLMDRHREILAPKFDLLKTIFRDMFRSRGDVNWTDPKGGYFIDLSTPAGFAARAVALAAEAGITLTAAGAAFPYVGDRRPAIL